MKFHLLLLALFTLLAGCTSKLDEGVDPSVVVELNKTGCVGAACAVCDLPWGGELPAGQVLDTVYSSELVACGGSCDEHRARVTCTGGKLEATNIKSGQKIDLDGGARLHKACYARKCNCTHGGVTVLDGDERVFHRASQVSCPSTCTDSRTLVCQDGVMIDKLLPTNKNHPNNYRAASCSALPCANCTLESGDVIAHGGTQQTFSVSSVTCSQSCTSYRATLRCTNGVISGGNAATYKFTTCAPPANCARCVLPCSRQILPGASDYCYRASKPASCGLSCLTDRKLFKCSATSVLQNEDNSPVSAADMTAYKFTTCDDRGACEGCTVPGVGQVADGARVPFFKNRTVACGQSCLTADNQVMLTCADGEFGNRSVYPDYKYGACTSSCKGTSDGDLSAGRIEGLGGGAPNSVCGLPWKSGIVTHNTEVTAYSRSTVNCGDKCANYKATIKCNGYRGLWSGGGVFIHPTCVDPKCP